MKKTLLFATMLAILTIFSACKKDEPTTNAIFTEPYLGWGAAPAVVKVEMEKLGFACKSFEEQTYTSNGKETQVSAFFNEGSLYSYYFYFNSALVTFSEIDDVLNSKYNLSNRNADYKQYITKDGKTGIQIGTDTQTGYVIVAYYDVAMVDEL